ncbi:hypothetical protein J7T55_000452 [Diaporthe amygdali]|uniref:uncharacterized protein n=1 Tax=Phomopsis amygdali TaxID=1214568 RepID=UPI0022FF432F|nr:uncharacterized protein J7T55_000452 [Diaporthe amygdali]KAJ0103825.1 hypothetical protein J7T55_000452 [Diaporthe amygdali]
MSETKLPKESLPSGYSFVPKGNVYITGHCRRLTKASGRSVYVVIDGKKQQIGLGVPTDVYVGVQFQEINTRTDRTANVLKRDETITKTFQKEVLKIYPRIPAESLRNVLKMALKKGKGKVGRAGKLNVHHKVRLAVRAHVRHCETEYDSLLKSGVAREDARQQVEPKIREVCLAWGDGTSTKLGNPGKAQNRPARHDTKASQPKKQANQRISRKTTTNSQASSLNVAVGDAVTTKATKTVTQSTGHESYARRNAKRAYRLKKSITKVATNHKEPKKQQKTKPKIASPEAVATAASFRERRTPRPMMISPSRPVHLE